MLRLVHCMLILVSFLTKYPIFVHCPIPNILTIMLKNLFIISVIILLASACSSVKPATSGSTAQEKTEKNSSVTFIESISLTPGSNEARKNNLTVDKNNFKYKEKNKDVAHPSSIEAY